MSPLRRVTAAMAAALTVLSSFLIANPATAAPSPTQDAITYVSLGDSYAAGLGAGTILDECGRTANAYPVLVAAANGLALTQLACAGATLASVASTQLPQLPADTNYVTIQVGGNDIGFVQVLQVCAQPRSNAACTAAIRQSRAYLNSTFTANAVALFAAVKKQAPNVHLIVIGYPRLFGNRDCSPLTTFSAAERSRLNSATTLLNTKLRQAATQAGGYFANPVNSFSGHAWCARNSWINGPADPPVASFHPNQLGQTAGYVPLVNGYFLS